MKRILIIDEDNYDAKNIENLLSDAGYKTYVAENGLDGFEIAKRYLPDLILCSIQMKGLNGTKIIFDLINFEQTSTIPIICLTQNTNVKELRKLMNTGADDFIDKPFANDDLLLSVKMRLKKNDVLKNKFQQFSADRFEEEEKEPEYNDHILVKIGNRLNFIKFSEIICLTALKEYSKINLENGKKIVVRKSLKKWNSVLPEDTFLQIHRATIINMDFIEEAKKISERSYQVKMKCMNDTFILSKRFANKLRKKFSVS
ncbi:MAG: hypothetical protein A2068_14685 [Ignavibacteria bacterium GWB2_35_6b]|nr:MAG: hypothetical protein A2068_14685 [Ignavibacteria bacterium GWB2_35_6b]